MWKACTIGMIGALCLTAQNWKDRGEYDQVLILRDEPLPAKREALIEEWKKKYPQSELAGVRAELAINNSLALGDNAAALAAARELVAFAPGNFAGLYWLTVLTPGSKAASPAEMDQLGVSAKKLLADAKPYFEVHKTEDPAVASHVNFAAHRALGWLAWNRAAFADAESELRECLAIDPQQGEISAWLGTILAIQDKRSESLFHLARAVNLPGESLTASKRSEVRTILEALYLRHHGASEGLEQLGTVSKASPLPPADFSIETAEHLRLRLRDEALVRSNPDLAPWLKMRRALEAKDGDAAFEKMKGAPTPRLKGTLLQCELTAPAQATLALADTPGVASVQLIFSDPITVCAALNTELEFEGIPVSYSAEPFLLKLQTDKTKISGWPEPEPPPAPAKGRK